MATVGQSAPSQNTINYDALLSTTLMAYRATLVDQIFKSSAFLAALRKYDGIDYQDGGERIWIPLMYEENSTVKSYSGYETLDTTPQDGITSAFFPWCEVGGTISISRKEERQNSGEAALMKLLKVKTTQAEMSMKSQLNSQLILGTVNTLTFVPGNGTKDLFPLGYFLPLDKDADPLAGGNVGNISRLSYSWWRCRTAALDTGTASTDGNDFAIDADTFIALEMGLKRMYNYCSRGADGSGPNLCVMNQVTYESYETAMAQRQRYFDTDLADMGFDTIRLKGANCIWDELVPDIHNGTAAITDGTAFFLNTRFYKLVIDSQTDFITTPFIEPKRNLGLVKPRELRETPNVKTRAIRNQAQNGKVQRLSDYRSRIKRSEARGIRKNDEIVSSSWKHEAAMKMAA